MKLGLMMKGTEWFRDQQGDGSGSGSGSEGFPLGKSWGWKSQSWEDFGGRKQGWSLPWESHVLKWWKGSRMAKFILVIFLLGTTCSCKSIPHHSSTLLKRRSLSQKLLINLSFIFWYIYIYIYILLSFLQNKVF